MDEYPINQDSLDNPISTSDPFEDEVGEEQKYTSPKATKRQVSKYLQGKYFRGTYLASTPTSPAFRN